MLFHYYYTQSRKPSTSSLRQRTEFSLHQRTAFPLFYSPNHVPALSCGCLIIGNRLGSFLAVGAPQIIVDIIQYTLTLQSIYITIPTNSNFTDYVNSSSHDCFKIGHCRGSLWGAPNSTPAPSINIKISPSQTTFIL